MSSIDLPISRDYLFVDGGWKASSGADSIPVISPSSEQEIGHVPRATASDIDDAVKAARRAFDLGDWPHYSAQERAGVLRRMQALFEDRMEALAQLITKEMGSPISFSRIAQAPQPSQFLGYYASLIDRYPFEELRAGPLGDAIVRREPVGVVGAIVPWNYPQATAMMKLAPALAAGCTVVLKPAAETPLDAFVLAEIAEEAGLPAGVLNVVPADRDASEHLVTHPLVDKISFTGSTTVGRRIASLCGQDIRRVTLELGGKSAAVVLDDADLDIAIEGLRRMAFVNTSQTCSAQTRVLVDRRHYAAVVERLAEVATNFRVGDPLDDETEIGPLVSRRQRDRVEAYIGIGIEEGARVVAGGSNASGQSRGWFVAPTIFADVANGMRVAQEEIFGPVIAVLPFDGDREAVTLANDSPYGLSGSVWTSDVDRGVRIARQVRTGQYRVNGASGGIAAPFGGYKASGIGRELGPEGLLPYLETKAISVPKGSVSLTQRVRP